MLQLRNQLASYTAEDKANFEKTTKPQEEMLFPTAVYKKDVRRWVVMSI